jgi:RluA family pseudouridine synthase
MTESGSALPILYQDRLLLVVNKPAGLPTQATRDPRRPHLVAAAEQLLASQGVRQPYVGLHHRLDVDTSGVVVLAVHPDANRALSDAFRDRQARKQYLCLCDAFVEPPNAWEVDNHLRVHAQRRGRSVEVVRAGGQRATTTFEVLERGRCAVRVLASPTTGRTHQIRVHCEGSGVPIVGDPVYRTERGVWAPRVMLHAWRLEVPHPSDGRLMQFEAPEPEDMATLWGRLRAG